MQPNTILARGDTTKYLSAAPAASCSSLICLSTLRSSQQPIITITRSTDATEVVPVLPGPLPVVLGPKLSPFTPTAHARIDFVQQLSHSKNQGGHFWEVIINGETFALKMVFRFNTWQHLATSSGKYLTDPLAADQAHVDYFDPFNCECRAYGRLQEEGRQDLAVRAHGYLLLTPDQERTVTAEFDPESLEQTGTSSLYLDGDGPWGRYEQHRGQLVRAIVKDIAEDNDSFTAAQVPQLWTDLEAMHSLGILVRDIYMGNYMDGKLVDFSLA